MTSNTFKSSVIFLEIVQKNRLTGDFFAIVVECLWILAEADNSFNIAQFTFEYSFCCYKKGSLFGFYICNVIYVHFRWLERERVSGRKDS